MVPYPHPHASICLSSWPETGLTDLIQHQSSPYLFSSTKPTSRHLPAAHCALAPGPELSKCVISCNQFPSVLTIKSMFRSLAESPLLPCSSYPSTAKALAAAGAGIGGLELCYASGPLLGWSQFLSCQDKCLIGL